MHGAYKAFFIRLLDHRPVILTATFLGWDNWSVGHPKCRQLKNQNSQKQIKMLSQKLFLSSHVF